MTVHPARIRRENAPGTESLDRARVLDTLFNNLDGMAYRCHTDAQWTIVFVSQGCLALTGYAPADMVQNAKISCEQLTHPLDRTRVRSTILSAIEKGQRFAVEYRIVTQSGTIKWVLERGIGVLDEQGELVIECFIEDMTDRRELAQAQKEAELRYRHIFEHASEGIFQTTPEGRYVAANPALARLYGYASPESLIQGLSDIENQLYVHNEQRTRFRKLMELQGQVQNFESEVYKLDGSKIWISENAHIVRDSDGRVLYYEGTVQDISDRKRYQEELEHQANHDILTGLPNRILLADRVEQGIARATRLGYFLTVVFIDLDNFKFINDGLGHDAGDVLLKEVAQRLTECVRASDTVARLGGDEFILLLTDHFQTSSVISQLRRVLSEIGRPVLLSGRGYQVGASLGVAMYPNDGQDSSALLRHADVAMYAAKNGGRNNFQFFRRELNHVADERLHMEASLRQAIDHDELEVHYQPKFDHRRRIVGVEALARWPTPTGMVSPDRFIPVAEESGLILSLTTAIFRQAFAATREWNQLLPTPLRVAVNLSARLFQTGDVVAHISGLLTEAKLDPALVELEITESVFMGDSERVIGSLNALKDLGILLAMDDFGAGYSSLSYLRRLPLDIIKIDRSLVTDLEHEEEVAMIARAVISLGHSLRKTVVAEGVENQAQFDFLRYQGCHEFQGYLLSRPLPHEACSHLLQAQASAHVNPSRGAVKGKH